MSDNSKAKLRECVHCGYCEALHDSPALARYAYPPPCREFAARTLWRRLRAPLRKRS